MFPIPCESIVSEMSRSLGLSASQNWKHCRIPSDPLPKEAFMRPDLKARITELVALHEAGLLTDEELQKHKDSLITAAMALKAESADQGDPATEVRPPVATQLHEAQLPIAAGSGEEQVGDALQLDPADDVGVLAKTTSRRAPAQIVLVLFGLLAIYAVAFIAYMGSPIDRGELGEMVKIEGGSYVMGTSTKLENEQPEHRVNIPTFEIMKTEVTVGQYRLCVRAKACEEPSVYHYECNWERREDDYPMNCVNSEEAWRFAKWAGGRLPTEAEWEYAARSRGQLWNYPWGLTWATCAHAVMHDPDETFPGCGSSASAAVCSRPMGHSEQGICDLAGNVFELVADAYHENYHGAPTDGSAWGPGEDDRIVARGGAWTSEHAGDVMATTRVAVPPTFRNGRVGFRLAR